MNTANTERAHLATFQRQEVKYLLSVTQLNTLLHATETHLIPDAYPHSTICSLYYDTQNFQMIRSSLEKPLYKEKFRLRSYGVPNAESIVFAELKKKYRGIVYKRRVDLRYDEALIWLSGGKPPQHTQITDEIDWVFRFYHTLLPSVLISYERDSWVGAEDSGLRITIDSSLLFRDESLTLDAGIFGTQLLTPESRLMEIKTLGAMPLWLSSALDSCQIYPASYSKYGNAFLTLDAQKQFFRVPELKGVVFCA